MTSASRWSASVRRASRERCEPTLIATAHPCPHSAQACPTPRCAQTTANPCCAPAHDPHAALQQHADLIKLIASRLYHDLLPLSEQELEHHGHIALLELAQRHYPRQVSAALVWQRVRGAMIDACRREGWHSRRDPRRARPQIRIELLEPHTFDEQQADPHDEPRARADLQNTLHAALAELPELDRAILLQHDLHEIPLRELARSMRRAPSRISHRRREALDALRDRLIARGIHSSADLL
jgi:RNA polymerase sigma factor (sigma-70 family)